VSIPIPDPGGTHELFVVYRAASGGESPFKFNWFAFEGQGVADERGEPVTPEPGH
jgi:hypothetical protein